MRWQAVSSWAVRADRRVPRERWDYVYYYRDGSTRKVQRRQFSVFFGADHRLSRVSGDVEVAATEELTTPQARTRVIDL